MGVRGLEGGDRGSRWDGDGREGRRERGRRRMVVTAALLSLSPPPAKRCVIELCTYVVGDRLHIGGSIFREGIVM